MQGQKITVFGGSGFIGRAVVRKLLALGASIRVAVKHPGQALYLKQAGHPGQVTLEYVNFSDPENVRYCVAGADAVVNLVGILYEKGRATFDRVHGDAALAIAEAARDAGVRRLVHVSAIGADPQAASHYARSKALGEANVRKAFPDAVILRPSLVFGADDRFFNRFADVAMLSPALPLFGGGRTKFQPVYVGDVADAVVAALERGAGKTFELGGPEAYTFKDLMAYMLLVMRRKRALVPLPFWVGRLIGGVAQFLPEPLLTPDQVLLLQQDAVVGKSALTIRDLGITPVGLEQIVPIYLARFRPVE